MMSHLISRVIISGLLSLIVLVNAPMSLAAERRVSIIIDTSGSMRDNDRPRYTVQLAKIIADLLDNSDKLSVIGMPRFGSCFDSANNAPVFEQGNDSLGRFKGEIDLEMNYGGGNQYAGPIRAAISRLGTNSRVERLLLIIADSGGLGDCDRPLRPEMVQFRNTGATLAAINLGSSAGAFDRHPAFNFTTAALNSERLVEAVATVYQKFLGAKDVQTGRVEGAIQVDIAPFVKEAFLVVAADGPIDEITQGASNPKAGRISLNHRGGGETIGLEGRTRAYRIVRMVRPNAGRWSFNVKGLRSRAGWMLLQDFSIGLRLIPNESLAVGQPGQLIAELFDETTGQTLTDLNTLPGVSITTTVGGRPVQFKSVGGGRLVADFTPQKAGQFELPIRVQSNILDKTEIALVKINAQPSNIPPPPIINVPPIEPPIEPPITDPTPTQGQQGPTPTPTPAPSVGNFNLRANSPSQGELNSLVTLSVELQNNGNTQTLTKPARIDAQINGTVVPLYDNGSPPDKKANDGYYSGQWAANRLGSVEINYQSQGINPVLSASGLITVVQGLKFGPALPVDFGTIKSDDEIPALLDLSSATLQQAEEVEITGNLDLSRVSLDINLGQGFVALNDDTIRTTLSPGQLVFPLIVRAGCCPEGSSQDFSILIRKVGSQSPTQQLVVPVKLVVLESDWLTCWWPIIAAVILAIITGVIIHGFVSPYRFSKRIGVVISPEDDISEGFFHQIRGTKGSGSGFYQDAKIYLCADYRLYKKPMNAIASIKAHGKNVMLQPQGGALLWRLNIDDTWEQVPITPSIGRVGVLYKTDNDSLFFELRNG